MITQFRIRLTFPKVLLYSIASEIVTLFFSQVTVLSEYRLTQRQGGRSRKVTKLVQIVDKASANFIAVGKEIANENPEFEVCTKIPALFTLKAGPYLLVITKTLAYLQVRVIAWKCIKYVINP